jgi:hypothetical protein
MKQRHEIIIDVNQEKLFDLLIDINRCPEEVQIVERVYDIRRPESYMFTYELEGIENRSSLMFISIGDHSTKLIIDMNITSKSALARFFMFISTIPAKKKAKKSFAKLKSYAENLEVQ